MTRITPLAKFSRTLCTMCRYVAVLLLICSPTLFGQAGRPAYIPMQDSTFDSVDVQNLNVLVHAPIFSKAGAMPLSVSWSANSYCRASTGTWQCGVQSPTVTNFGAVTANGFMGGPTNIGWATAYPLVVNHSQCPDKTSHYVYNSWVLREANGTLHPLPPTDWSAAGGDSTCINQGFTDTTIDGSGFTVTVGQGLGAVGPIVGPDGTTINQAYPSATSITDVHGNILSINSTHYNDTLGLAAATASPNVNAPTSVSWTDVNGGSPQVSVNTANVSFQTNFGCSGISEVPAGSSAPQFSGLSFPDGTSLTVTYEPTAGKTGYVTGRIKTLTLPTGGTITYTYSGLDCTHRSFDNLSRATSDGTTTYSVTPAGTNYGSSTTVTDPAGNRTVYQFSYPSTYGNVVLTMKQVYQGTSTLLEQDNYCYNNDTTHCTASTAAYAVVTFPITQKTVSTTPNGSLIRKSSFTFDAYGNVLTDAEYDFGAGSPTRTTTITYGSWNGSNCVSIGNNINNKPCDVLTTQGGNSVAESHFTYDTHGNLLTTALWTGSRWLQQATANSYNPNGTPITTYDVANIPTTYAYNGADYTHCGSCTQYLFPTSISKGGLTSSATWDGWGGVKLTDVDMNGRTTTYGYTNSSGTADPFWRVSSVTDPLNNTAYTIYGANTTESKMSFGSSLQDTIFTVDGYGRQILSQTKHSSTYDTVSTSYGYNSTGPTVTTSIPCSAALGAGCTTGFTTSGYDPLGRPVASTDGGGATVNITYPQQDVLTVLRPAPSGENVKQDQIEYDGLGRPTFDCGILSSGGSPCGEVSGGSGVSTAFGYSTAAGSTTTTATRGVQTRSTVKDALGRTISTTDPERGTAQYTYDYYAPTLCTDPASMPGRLYFSILPSGNGKCFNYDTIGRLTDVGEYNIGAGVLDSGSVCTRFRFDTSSNGLFTAPGTISNGVGRLVEAETDNCTVYPPTAAISYSDEWFSYDAKGNITDEWERTQHSGGYYHVAATWFANKQLASLGIPGLGTVTYTIDGDGRLQTATLGRTLVNGVTYGPTGPTTINIGSSTDEDIYGYSATTGNPSSYQFTVGSASNTGTLNWNTNETLGSLVIADGFNSADNETCTYIYDDVARLTSDQCGTPWAQTYGYDMFDNLNQFGSSPFTYTYYAANNHYSTSGVTYDADGDLTYDGLNNYTYNDQDKLWSVYPTGTSCASSGSANCYIYDAFGHMVESESGGSYTQTLYGPNGLKLAGMTGQTLSYAFIPMPGGSQVLTSGASTFYYLHLDWLGSARTASTIPTSGTGTIFFDRQFAPYSQMYGNSGSAGTGSQIFTGDTQQAVGLFDTPNRELNQSQGRWLTPDPARSGWNQYAYPTNPNSYIDPSGLNMQAPGTCQGGEGLCPWEGGGMNPTSISGGGFVGTFFQLTIPGYWQPGKYGEPSTWIPPTYNLISLGGSQQPPEAPPDVFASNNVAPANPCQYAGRALTPADYAAEGAAANQSNYSWSDSLFSLWGGTGATNFYLNLTGFPRGHYLDPQPFGSGNGVQNAAYGNYAYGVYMQAAGVPLSFALSGANAYANISGAKYGPVMGPMDARYTSLPAANVTNITNGYNAQANGTTCKPAGPTPKPPNG
jgi:RHS repeat-associated protein